MVRNISKGSSFRLGLASAAVALFSFVLLPGTPAEASGHGGSHGGGGGHSGGGHSSHAGGSSGRTSGRSSAHVVAGVRAGGAWRGGGFRGWGGYYGFRPYWGWGWGWDPFWSSWWWGGPGVYVVPNDQVIADDDDDTPPPAPAPRSDASAPRPGRFAIVRTDVTPEEAQVYLDGKYIGTADDFVGRPDYLYLGPGKYHVEFRLPNYQTYATDLDIARGQRVRLEQSLKLQPGKSALDQFPPDAKGTPLGRVFVKGPNGDDVPPPPMRRAQAPRGDDGWSDRGGNDRSTGSAPPARAPRQDDGFSDNDAPPPPPQAPAPRAYAPQPQGDDSRADRMPRAAGNRARMRFKVTPEDAAVYVDDKYLGAGEDLAANPRGVVTDPGTHTITVTRPGYKTKTMDITVRVGAPVDVVVELEK